MLSEHGGEVLRASRNWGIPQSQWLDLSTGINPVAWPVPAIPASYWHELPQASDELQQPARDYYQCSRLLGVAGSQAAIQWLPLLRHHFHDKARAGVLTPSFSEHARNWQQAGHEVLPVTSASIESRLAGLDVLVLVNPNNPTAEIFSKEQLLDWHRRLASRGGWLVVDEAFMDTTPHHSLVKYTDRPGLIVLRSLGKFWGLPGARAGFVLAPQPTLDALESLMGPWLLSGPAAYVASQALADVTWQGIMRRQLEVNSGKLVDLLAHYGLKISGRTSLFAWLEHEDAIELFEAFASLGVLVRVFPAAPDATGSLRFGLPGSDEQWQRLASALSVIMS